VDPGIAEVPCAAEEPGVAVVVQSKPLPLSPDMGSRDMFLFLSKSPHRRVS
jgi:hypothetical protein